MHSGELVAALRATGQLPTADPTYTTARLLQELTDMQQQLFERLLVNTREGHLLQQALITTVAGQSVYRLPARSVTQGAERVEISTGADGKYRPLTKLTTRQASDWESNAQGSPSAFVVRTDSIQLIPTPSSALSVRVHYYLRPGSIVEQQLVAPGTHRGRVTGTLPGDPGVLQINTNAAPHDMLVSPTTAVAIGSVVDVMRADGSHAHLLVSAAVTLVIGNAVYVHVGDLTPDIRAGDYVRVAEQSEWPQMPPEFHRTLVDATAAAILLSKGVTAKAQALAAKVRSDLERYTDLLNPRVKDQPKVIKPRYGVLRGRSLGWPGRRL